MEERVSKGGAGEDGTGAGPGAGDGEVDRGGDVAAGAGIGIVDVDVAYSLVGSTGALPDTTEGGDERPAEAAAPEIGERPAEKPTLELAPAGPPPSSSASSLSGKKKSESGDREKAKAEAEAKTVGAFNGDDHGGEPLEKTPALPSSGAARYGRVVSSLGGGSSGGGEFEATAGLETSTAPSPDGRGGSNFRISTTRGSDGSIGSGGDDGGIPSTTNPELERVEAELGLEESVLGNETSEEAAEGSGSRMEGGDASSALPHLSAVLAEGGSNDVPVPLDQSRETILRRMFGGAQLIDGEHVVAIGSGGEQGFDDKHGNNSGVWYKNQRKVGIALLVAVVLIAGVSVGVVFGLGRGQGDDNVTKSGAIRQQPEELQPSSPPSASTATQLPTASKTSARFDRFGEVVLAANEGGTAAEELTDTSSPQRRALQWLADEDEYAASVWPDGDEGVGGGPVNEDEGALLLQRYALAVLFFATGGGDGNWTSSCGFLEPVHECEWYEEEDYYYDEYTDFMGVNCSDTEMWIKELRLSSNNLVGTVPEEIRFLPQLAGLALYSNLLEGTIPASLGDLTELVRIELEDNELTGTIPATIGNLHKLQHLFLYDNLLTGPIPSSLGSLSELLGLNLELNSLTGEIPEELGNLSKLEVLYLAGNSLTGPIPESIGRLSNLTRLRLWLNALSGTIPLTVNNLSKLEMLDTDDNILSGSLPFTAGSLPSLQFMYLSENHFTGTIPEAIFTYTSLRHIQLYSNNITGTISPNIANLTKLQVLELDYNMLNGSFPLALTTLGALEILGLSGNRFGGTLPSEIAGLQNLTVLNLFGNEFTGTLPDAMGNLSNLKELGLGNNYFRGTLPKSFVGMTSLGFLDLAANDFDDNLNFMCDILDSSGELFRADCHGDEAEVVCDCCNICCSDSDKTGPVYDCFPA